MPRYYEKSLFAVPPPKLRTGHQSVSGLVSGSRQYERVNGELVRMVDGAKRDSVRAFRQLFLSFFLSLYGMKETDPFF